MKTRFTYFHYLFALMLMFGILSGQIFAQTVNVKMQINTATCLDTLRSNHIVLVCGESRQGTTPAITWDNTSGISATNVGGDYWEAEFQAVPGDSISFKFVTYFDLDNPTFHWDGWEGPIAPVESFAGSNRSLVVGENDTTLALQYYNGWENTVGQYEKPFETYEDSVAIFFRVNMGGANFDPSSQLVDVRGGAPLGTDDPWITIITLSQEENSVNGGSFWSGTAYISKDSVTANDQQEFKFVVQSPETWENTPNRSFTFTEDVIARGDTTIHWYYFNDIVPQGERVTADILFRLKLDALEKCGLFNRALGDRVGVTGAKGWVSDPFDFETDPAMLKMTYNADLEEWNLVEPFTLFPTEIISYKYYVAWDSSRVDTTSPNYIPGLDLTNGWEEPGVTGGADRTYIFTSETQQVVPGDFGAEQQFFNSLDPNGVINNQITVTFSIDMAPAASEETNPTNPLFRPGTDSVFVQFDGSFVPVTQGLTMYGTDNRLELFDPDGDLVYEGSWELEPPTLNQLCYRITYSNEPGTPITNGGGILYGRRYYQYIHPTSVGSDGTITWPDSYELNQMTWVASDLTVEDPPDLTSPTSVGPINGLPMEFKVTSNYPNPFNPSTTVKYTIPEKNNVSIKVYDAMGALVKELVNETMFAGEHEVKWNGRNNNNVPVASGVYFMNVQSGNYYKTIKMMLLK